MFFHSTQPCHQLPSGTISRVCYPSTMLSTMDKAGFQKNDAKHGFSLSWKTSIIFPLSDKPNNRALSFEALPTYIYRPPTHLLNFLSPATATQILPPNSPTNPQTQLPQKKKAPVAKHKTKMCHLQNTFTCSHSTTMALNSFCTCGLTVTCIQQTRCPQASCQPQTTNRAPKQNSKQGNSNRR
jgi:hypothetical protein